MIGIQVGELALSEHVIAKVKEDFPDAELNTALWLLRECATDHDRLGALLDADGDLATLVLATEERTKVERSPSGHRS
jgi:hypothetical protein